MRDTKPLYNLKVVVRETGINPDTLRAWERRYGLPSPERTSGGQRLYSARDVETVKWLMARQSKGLAISKAVRLWHDLEVSGQDPLDLVAKSRPDMDPPELARARQEWVRACLDFDEAAAEHALSQAFARFAPEIVCLAVLQGGLAEVGRLWHEDKASVQQEHFALALAERRVSALLTAAPTPTRRRSILIGCPPEEDHAFPALLLALLLRYHGWGIVYLGASVPLARLETTLQATRPALVVLTAQMLYTASRLLEMAGFLESRGIPLAYGGHVFNRLPSLQGAIPGYFLGQDLAEAPRRIEAILTAPPAMPTGTPVSESYRRALASYRDQRLVVEGHVRRIMQSRGLAIDHLEAANLHLGRNVVAALTFGDLSLLDQEIAWAERLLAHRGIPRSSLALYLEVYHQVASEHLDEACYPVLAWLEEAKAKLGEG